MAMNTDDELGYTFYGSLVVPPNWPDGEALDTTTPWCATIHPDEGEYPNGDQISWFRDSNDAFSYVRKYGGIVWETDRTTGIMSLSLLSKFNSAEIREWLEGWRCEYGDVEVVPALSLETIIALLDCKQYGIEAYFERKDGKSLT